MRAIKEGDFVEVVLSHDNVFNQQNGTRQFLATVIHTPSDTGDHDYRWCECNSCGAIGMEFDGRSDRLPCKAIKCPRSYHGDKGYNSNSPRLMRAYEEAISYRF